MKVKQTISYISILAVTLYLLPVFALARKLPVKNRPNYQDGQLLVKLKNNPEILNFKFSDQVSLQELLKLYGQNSAVEYVEPNYRYNLVLEPRDTYYSQQTYLSTIKAHLAWNISTGSSRTVIAILDSGIDLDHPDLVDNLWVNPGEIPDNNKDDDNNGYIDDINGWDFVDDDHIPSPELNPGYDKTAINHGTVVSGIISAKGGNKSGISGIDWFGKLMPLKVLDHQGSGYTDKVASAIDYAVSNGADVINLSFVGTGKSITLEKAIKRAYQAGVVVVAAAGNEVNSGVDMDLEQNLAYPVCHDGPSGENWVIGVAALDNSDRLASFSNYGKNCVDISAPGLRLFSSSYQQDGQANFKNHYLGGWTGTSVAAPQVSGAVSLMKGIKPDLSVKQIQQILKLSAENIDYKNTNYQGKLGAGLLNVYAALSRTIETQTLPSQTGQQKIITTPALGGGPHLKVFDKSFMENEFLAFDSYYRGQLSVAKADLDGDGEIEVIVGLGPGVPPWFRIFSQEGELKSQFMAYSPNFRGGVEVAVGDTDGDGVSEIITGAGKGGGPHIRIFGLDGKVKSQFFAYDKSFRGGIELAAGDIDGDGISEIVVVPKSNMSPLVKIFKPDGKLVSSFLALDQDFKNGLHLAIADVAYDSRPEIIIGAGSGGGPQVRIFDSNGGLMSQFFAYDENFRGGVYVGASDIDGDGGLEVVTGAGSGGGPHVRFFNYLGGVKHQFFAYSPEFRGGVRIASD